MDVDQDSEVAEDTVTDEEQDDDNDSDEALRDALASGKLKPGLYGQFTRANTPRGKVDREGLENVVKSIRLDLAWIERLDVVGGLAPLSRSAYEAVGVDFDEKAVEELEQLEATLSGQNEEDESSADAKRKRQAKVQRAERSIVANDFVREMHFYRQAQASAAIGLEKLHEAGVVTKRPADYFAEMAKGDAHMQRVRDRLLHLENRLALAEKAKRIRDARRFAKQAERERSQQQRASKRQLDDLVDSVRKGKRSAADLERELTTETSRAKLLAGSRATGNTNKRQKGNTDGADKREQSRRPDGRQQQQGNNRKSDGKQLPPRRRNKKRERKDEKYGFGGQKKRSKWNTKESNEDVERSFSKWRKAAPKPMKKGPNRGGQRPGKLSRQRFRNKQAS